MRSRSRGHSRGKYASQLLLRFRAGLLSLLESSDLRWLRATNRHTLCAITVLHIANNDPARTLLFTFSINSLAILADASTIAAMFADDIAMPTASAKPARAGCEILFCGLWVHRK